jgi:hypothetical protein
MLFMALWAQFPHAKFVFHNLIPTSDLGPDSNSQAIFYAATIEGLIAIFVVHNWHKFSYIFALVSVATNVAYYQIGGIDMFNLSTKNLWVYWLFSIILPTAIAALTHLFAEALSNLSPAPAKQGTKQATVWGLPDLSKVWDSLSSFKFGLVVELVKRMTSDEPQGEVVTVVPPQPTTLPVPTQVPVVTPEPQPALVDFQLDDKYLPIVNALMGNRDGLLPGQLAKATGIAQATLYRKDLNKGWLIDLVNKQVLVTRQDGDKLFYLLKGE